MKKKLLLLACHFFLIKIVAAQFTLRNPDKFVEVNCVVGTHFFNNSFHNYTIGVDVDFVNELYGDKYYWATVVGALRSGTEINYRNLKNLTGNKPIDEGNFGEAIGLLKNVDIKLFANSNFDLTSRIGFGVAGLTKTSYTNPKNDYISSFVNLAMKLNLFLNWQISKNTIATLGLGTYHISSGAIFLPEKGLNFLDVSAGIRFFFAKGRLNPPDVNPNTYFYRHSFSLAGGLGRRGIDNTLNGILKYDANLYYHFNFQNHTTLIASFDIINSAKFDPDNYTKTYQSKATTTDNLHFGASVGGLLKLDNTHIGATFGRYINNISLYNINYYWTILLQQYFTKDFGIQSRVYINDNEIDFISLGVLLHIGDVKERKSDFEKLIE